MIEQRANAQIDEGQDGWGSRHVPLESPCECVVQRTVRPGSDCTSDCTTHCTDDCTIDRIVLVGARGGSGTSTIAAVLGLIGRAMVRTEFVTTDPNKASALLGCATPDQFRAEILSRPSVVRDPSGDAELEIVDAGPLEGATAGPRTVGERRLVVLRGPCHLAPRTLLAADHDLDLDLDGSILVAEPDRAFNERDVADVTGLDVVATAPVTPGIARTIDAGFLAARHQNQREFRDLRHWLTTQLDPVRTHRPAG